MTGTGWSFSAVNTTPSRELPMSLPSRRETLTPPGSEAVNVTSVCVDLTSGVGSWSRHWASSRPMPSMTASGTTGPSALSTARRYLVSEVEPPRMTSLRKRPGRRPLPGPADAVATSLPAERFSDEDADTALLWSTAPALRAKSTAATAVPDRATIRAMTATTIAGDGILRRMGDDLRRGGPRASCPRFEHGRYREHATVAAPAARTGAKSSGTRPSLS